MKVAFRVDASVLIGSGHVMRCLTLANAIAAHGAKCHFICRELVGNLLEIIRQRNYAVYVLPAPTDQTNLVAFKSNIEDSASRNFYESWLGVSWQEDSLQTRSILQMLQPDLLVVDHYALDHRWEVEMRPYSKKLMAIDDLADRAHKCDLLLDQNLGRSPKDYENLVPKSCKAFTGPKYSLLRPEFAALRPYSLLRRQRPVIKRLLVTMGGMDQTNATWQVLEALQDCPLPPDCLITVVMGSQALWLDQVQAKALNMTWPTKVLTNINDMAQHMADSDLAIAAAGSTAWECCCMGLPTLLMVLAANQRPIAEALQGVGAAKILDAVHPLPEFSEVVSSLVGNPHALYDMSTRAAHIVDGLGTNILVSHFSMLEKK
jgi:UDP-2,4-diacetamido-2,4,6-trideoxy-beta-L-altropyranose hydrolase